MREIKKRERELGLGHKWGERERQGNVWEIRERRESDQKCPKI